MQHGHLAVEEAVHERHRLVQQHGAGGRGEGGIGQGRVSDVSGLAVLERIVPDDAFRPGVGLGGKVTIGAVDELGTEQEHHGRFPPAAVRIVAEGLPLDVGERATQRRLHLVGVGAGEKAPHEMAAERGHGDPVAPAHHRGGFVEGGQMSRATVPVGDEDVAEPAARERLAVIDDDIP